jgi:hypothetical protein
MQHQGISYENHRQHEVALIGEGMQIGENNDSPEHYLSNDSGNKTPRQHDQIFSIRNPKTGCQDCRNNDGSDKPSKQSIDLFNSPVCRGNIDKFF